MTVTRTHPSYGGTLTLTYTSEHTITLRRNDDRMSDRFGRHYYVETMNGVVVKVEYLDWQAYDRGHAYAWACAVARTYGAVVVDQRPAEALYGWSSD